MYKYIIHPFIAKYGTFEGRACRLEYWLMVVSLSASALLISVVTGVLARSLGFDAAPLARALPYVFQLVFGIPIISVGVRRLHDTNRSGWWWWIQMIPLLGTLWFFVLTILKGTKGENRFGPDPLDPKGKKSNFGVESEDLLCLRRSG